MRFKCFVGPRLPMFADRSSVLFVLDWAARWNLWTCLQPSSSLSFSFSLSFSPSLSLPLSLRSFFFFLLFLFCSDFRESRKHVDQHQPPFLFFAKIKWGGGDLVLMWDWSQIITHFYISSYNVNLPEMRRFWQSSVGFNEKKNKKQKQTELQIV